MMTERPGISDPYRVAWINRQWRSPRHGLSRAPVRYRVAGWIPSAGITFASPDLGAYRRPSRLVFNHHNYPDRQCFPVVFTEGFNRLMTGGAHAQCDAGPSVVAVSFHRDTADSGCNAPVSSQARCPAAPAPRQASQTTAAMTLAGRGVGRLLPMSPSSTQRSTRSTLRPSPGIHGTNGPCPVRRRHRWGRGCRS